MKKSFFIALFFFVCLVLTTLPTSAAYVGTVKFGSFEEAEKPDVTPEGWKVYASSPWYNSFKTSNTYAADGLYSLKTEAPKNSGLTQASIDGALYWGYFDTGAQYEISIKLLVFEDSSVNNALLRASLRDDAGNVSDVFTPSSARITGHTGGKWQTLRLVFTPKRSFGALETVYIRCNGGAEGTAYWDDLSLRKLHPDGSYADEIVSPLYPAENNILQNSSFSALTNGDTRAENWTSSGTWGEESSIQKGTDGEENYILLSEGENPYIYQTVEATGGQQLTLCTKYKTEGATGTPVLKFTYRDAAGTSIQEFSTATLSPTYGKWKDFTYSLTMPNGAAKVTVYLRKYGTAPVFYGHTALYKMSAPALLTLSIENKQTFFYSDETEGKATVTLNTAPQGKNVAFYLMDGERELYRQILSAAPSLSFTFPLSAPSHGKAYTLCAVLQENGGAMLDEVKKNLYCFERPAAIRENGVFSYGGETFSPVIGYHVYADAFEKAKAAGINVVQGMGAFETGDLGTFLDAALAHGLKVLVPLYSGNMLPAGHYVNRERTEAIINTYKTHPAVFGYMVQDEPFLQERNQPESVTSQLVESYRLCRSLDKVHPVYMTADCYSKAYYGIIGDTCDIIAPDDYALGEGRALESVYDNICTIRRAVRDKKPVIAILQTFVHGGIQPNIEELSHMICQSFLAGADAVGFYSFRETGWDFTSTALYAELCAFAKDELPLLYAAVQSSAVYDENSENGILLRQYPCGTAIGISLSPESRQRNHTLPSSFCIQFGNGRFDDTALTLSFPPYGRMIGNCHLQDFGETLSISGTESLRIIFTPDYRTRIPASARLYGAVYQKSGDAWELTGFSTGKTELFLPFSHAPGRKIVIYMVCPSDGRPIYKKHVTLSQN